MLQTTLLLLLILVKRTLPSTRQIKKGLNPSSEPLYRSRYNNERPYRSLKGTLILPANQNTRPALLLRNVIQLIISSSLIKRTKHLSISSRQLTLRPSSTAIRRSATPQLTTTAIQSLRLSSKSTRRTVTKRTLIRSLRGIIRARTRQLLDKASTLLRPPCCSSEALSRYQTY